MKINMPVTNQEILLKKGAILVTRTDLLGFITYANDEFVEVSGFSRDQLIGANHNIVRHPDMPAEAFEDLWAALKILRPWQGVVKNRAQSGDYYWVEANAIPVFQKGKVHEYLSIRRAPSREKVRQAEQFYALLNAGKVSLRPSGLAAMAKFIREIAVGKKIAAALALLLAPLCFLVYPLIVAHNYLSLAAIAVPVMLASAIAYSVIRNLTGTLNKTIGICYRLAEKKFGNVQDLTRNDLIGDFQRALYSMEVNLNLDLGQAREDAAKATRINQALDRVQSGVMVANTNFEIIYVNDSLARMFKAAELDIQRQLPDFKADKLLGANIDLFHRDPAHQRGLLEGLDQAFVSDLLIADQRLQIIASPVIDSLGERIGFVAEWQNKSLEYAIQQEVTAMVHGAVMGDFTRRIDMQGKEGFIKHLGDGLNELLETTESGINDVVRVLSALSRSDLTQTITNDYAGSFGQLKNDANTTVENLKDIIRQIKQATDNINTGSQEIAAGNNDLSHRTEEQAASLEETAASMEELTSTVQLNAENAKKANQLAINASGITEKGVEAVGHVVRTMDTINDSSRKIGDIISVIDDIAFQTNILALNAAVEAARAGEQGRGFAVVAIEVRNLAQRAATAAGEIKALIDDSVEKIRNGSQLAVKAGQTMSEIVDSIRGVTGIIAEISVASAQQSSGIGQVNQAIGQMDEVTQQNAALVEQAAASAESLEEQAHSLSDTVAKFKVDGSSRAALPKATAGSSFYIAPAKGLKPARAALTVNAPLARPPILPVSNDDWTEF